MRTVRLESPFYRVSDDPDEVIGDFLGFALSLKNISKRPPAEEFAELFHPGGRGMHIPDCFAAYRVDEPDDVPPEFGEEAAGAALSRETWVLTRLRFGGPARSALVEGDEMRRLLDDALAQHPAD